MVARTCARRVMTMLAGIMAFGAYPFRTAIVRYDIRTEIGHGGGPGGRPDTRKPTGPGTQVIWISGERLAKSTKVDGHEVIEVYTPDHVYSIDPARKSGTRIDNPKKPGRLAWARLSDAEKAAFQARLQARGVVSFDLPHIGAKTGSATILGRRCDVYQLGPETPRAPESSNPQVSMTTCLAAGGLPLRIVRASFLRREELVATKIDTNVTVPGHVFRVPAGVTITHDGERSEIERRHAAARFELFKNGTPLVVRIPVAQPSRQEAR